MTLIIRCWRQTIRSAHMCCIGTDSAIAIDENTEDIVRNIFGAVVM
jgi:hypothetical protein